MSLIFVLAYFESVWVAVGLIGTIVVVCLVYASAKCYSIHRRRRQRNRRQSRAVLPNHEEVTYYLDVHPYTNK